MTNQQQAGRQALLDRVQQGHTHTHTYIHTRQFRLKAVSEGPHSYRSGHSGETAQTELTDGHVCELLVAAAPPKKASHASPNPP